MIEEYELVFLSDYMLNPEGIECKGKFLVSDVPNMDIHDWALWVRSAKAMVTLPPWDVLRPGYSSRCADMARAESGLPTGAVVCGKSGDERQDYFMWAQNNNYRPIVLLPHLNRSRARQLLELVVPKYVNPTTWVHLAGRVEKDLDPKLFPGKLTMSAEIYKNE